MKEILVVYTGGTICSFEAKDGRSLDVGKAKRLIESKFCKNQKKFGISQEIVLKDSKIDRKTLSENMTTEKLCYMANHIKSFDLSKYQGIIVLHGTDTLAYTSAFFSFAFADLKIPMILVSGHKPPDKKGTNANDNFGTAVKLIADGIAPNVYAVYKNTNGKMWLHLGSTLMQSPNFSDDFVNASKNKRFLIGKDTGKAFEMCRKYSENRRSTGLKIPSDCVKTVLNIQPYTGLDYSRISLLNAGAVVHGTYHSGTVCVERNEEFEEYGSKSVLYLADECVKRNIPVFAAPSRLGSAQYSSVYDAVKNGGIIPLYMTTEAAYGKALLGIMNGISGEKLAVFMETEINNEFPDKN